MRKEIIELIENILPKYDEVEVKYGGHGREHIKDVITKSYDMAIEFKQNPEVCCVAALLHDIGLLTTSRKYHHIGSGIYVMEHIEMLQKYFNDEEIYIIFKAVIEHRSKFNGEYFSMISKIVSDADRSSNIVLMITRSYEYNKPNYNGIELQNVVYEHLKEKYYDRQYSFISKELQHDLDEARKILSNRELFNQYYDKITNNK